MLKHLHPDTGGDEADSDAFIRLQQAMKTLEANDA